MEEKNDSIFSVLRKEPQKLSFLLKFAIGGAFAVVALDWLASLFLPSVAVLPLELLLIIAYASGLTFLIAGLVQAADRFQVESALHARRLLIGRAPEPAPDDAEAGPARPSTPAPWSSSPFHQFYFLLRLTEEVKNARRDRREMSLVSIDVTLPGVSMTPSLTEKIGLEIAHMASTQSKTITSVFNVAPTEFVFSLGNSDQKETKAFVSKVVQALGNYWCHFGIAYYPKDASSAETLVERARRECDASRDDKSLSLPSDSFVASQVS